MNLFFDILFGKQPPGRPREGKDDLYPEGLTMGTLYIGRPGTGKTSSLARHLMDYINLYPDQAMFILDWSGSLTDMMFRLILQSLQWESILKRVVYDELGHPETCVPMPEFSEKYGPQEENVQRLRESLKRMNKELIEKNPTLGGLALDNAQDFFRMCTAIKNPYGECWQVTEVKKLILDEGLLKIALRYFGGQIPESKYSLEKVFLELKDHEKFIRTNAIITLLGDIEPREIRARIGYYKPGWTPRDAIEKGQIVIMNGARLINREAAQHYLFTQVYSLILQEINKRVPADPRDRPVSIVMDEVYSLLSIPGMAKEVGQLSPLYRSRKVILYVVLQSLSQLAEPLNRQIFSLGNIVCFALSDFEEAYEMAQQLFKYDPKLTRVSPATERNMPLMETDRGQYLTLANWIQRLPHRSCIMRRYVSERQLESPVIHVPVTKPHPTHPPYCDLWEVKERKLKEIGIPVRDALEIINQRKIEVEKRNPPQI